MKLSELLSADPVPARVFGVVVDVDEVDPPPGLREISFVAPVGPDGIDQTVLDVVISYLISQVEVVVEIAAEDTIENPSYLMSVAASVGVSLSFLPPVSDSEEAFEAYCQRLETFVKLYSEQPNFQKFLAPITSYLTYLMVEEIAPDLAATFRPEDDYIIERFAKAMSEERSDRLKARMRAAFEAVHGGAAEFSAFCRTLVAEVYQDVRGKLEEMSSQQAEPTA